MTVKKKRPGPGRPRCEQTRCSILAATFRLVTERGYPAVTAQTIAEEARAGKQTLYRWWDSKAAVVLDALAEHGRTAIDAAERESISSGDLERFLRSMFRAVRRNGAVLRYLMAEAQRDPSLREALLERLIEPRRATLRRLLSKQMPDRSSREAAVAAIYGAVWYRLLLDERLDDRFAGHLARLLSIRVSPTPTPPRG